MSLIRFTGLPDCMQGSRFLSNVNGDNCYAHQTTGLRGDCVFSESVTSHRGARGFKYDLLTVICLSVWVSQSGWIKIKSGAANRATQ